MVKPWRTLILVLMLTALLGCEKKETATNNNPGQEEALDKIKAARARRLAAKRQTEIENIKRGMGLISPEPEQPKEKAEPAWVTELYGRTTHPAAKTLCETINRLDAMQNALSFMKAAEKGEKPISWQEIGISEEKAQTEFRKLSLTTAKLLLDTLKLPRAVKQQMEEQCSADLTSPSLIIKEVEQILRRAEATPKDLGFADGTALRQVLLQALKSEVTEMQRLFNSGEKGTKEITDILRSILNEAEEWEFKATQLGITKKQQELMDKYEAEELTRP